MGIVASSPLQLILSLRCRRDTHTGARLTITPTSASAVQSDFHLLVHASHARAGSHSSAITIVSAQFRALTNLSLSFASKLVLICGQLHSYSTPFTVSLGIENLLHLTLNLIPRFPNPVPAGIRVPRWAILDVTVCLNFILFITAP